MYDKFSEIFNIMNNDSVENSFNRAQGIINKQPRGPESFKDMANDYASEDDCPNM